MTKGGGDHGVSSNQTRPIRYTPHEGPDLAKHMSRKLEPFDCELEGRQSIFCDFDMC